MNRERLPDRRPSITRSIDFEGIVIDFSIGFGLDGEPREIFARLRKPGSALDRLLDDATVALSLALQSGVTLEQLQHSLGRISDGTRASALGVMIDAMISEAAE